MNSTDTASRRCLLISELFEATINWLRFYGDTETMTVLARTCKTMHEAVLPTLWETQKSLRPLLQLFPSDSWAEILDEHGDSSFHITEPNQIEWTRFDHYAQHVQTLSFTEVKELSPLTLSMLSDRRPNNRPLFPKLRSLTLHDSGPSAICFPYIHLFLSPNLRFLELSSAHFDQSTLMCQVFKHIGETCKNVESLELWAAIAGGDYHPGGPSRYPPQKLTGDVNDALAQLLGGLPKLGYYVGKQLFTSANCVEALAVLPGVVRARLHVLPEEMSLLVASAACRLRGGQWFDALDEMSLHVDRLDESTSTFLDAIRSEFLRYLVIHSSIQPDSHTLKQHIERVARPSLQQLDVLLDRLPTGNRGFPIIDVEEVLQPLYAIPDLFSIEIRSPVLVVSARAIRDIANAWRGLGSLALDSYGLPDPGVDKPALTLEDLVPLAVNCLMLDEIVVPLNAEKIPDETTLTRLLPGPSRCGLYDFTAVHAPIEDPGRVADVLSRLFPDIGEVRYGHAAEPLPFEAELGTFEDKWYDVHKLIGGPIESESDEDSRAQSEFDEESESGSDDGSE